MLCMVDSKIAVVAAVAFLVISGGWIMGGLGGEGDTSQDAPDSANRVDTESPTPTQVPGLGMTLPKGVTASGEDALDDNEVLLTHQRSLNNTSFAADFEAVDVANSGREINTQITVRHEGNKTLRKIVSREAGVYRVNWQTGKDGFMQLGRGNYVYTTHEVYRSVYTMKTRIGAHTSFEYDFVKVKTAENGEKVAVLQENAFAPDAGAPVMHAPPGGDPAGYDSELWVNEDGQVVYLTYFAEYTYGQRGESSTKHAGELKISDIGSTSVEEPEWVDEARNESVVVDIRGTEEGMVAMTPAEGYVIPKGSEVTVADERGDIRMGSLGDGAASTVSQRVAPNDTLYVGEDVDGDLVVSVNEKPGGDVGYVSHENVLIMSPDGDPLVLF